MPAVILIGIESSLREELAAELARASFSALAEAWASAEGTTLRYQPSAVLVGVSQDPLPGIGLCQRLREGGYAGLIFLLMGAAGSFDVVRALDAGADDCVLAPVHGDVVVARLRASLRLARRTPLPVGAFHVQMAPDDLARLAYIGERKVRLTPIEARVLGALLEAEGGFVPTESLAQVASPEATLSRASLQVHMAHLRCKLGKDAWRIQNCRAVGYRFVGDVHPSSDSRGSRAADLKS